MAGKRRTGRQIAVQSLYLADTASLTAEEALEITLHDRDSMTVDAVAFGESLTRGTFTKRDEIDEYIRKHAKNWDISRMAAVDRCLLRLASYELLHEPETPVSVVINEAIELAKEFSSADSSKFINGILDKIKNYREKNTEY